MNLDWSYGLIHLLQPPRQVLLPDACLLASSNALTASLPVSRSTIFRLNAREYVRVMLPLSLSNRLMIEPSDNYPDTGGRNELSPVHPKAHCTLQQDPRAHSNSTSFRAP